MLIPGMLDLYDGNESRVLMKFDRDGYRLLNFKLSDCRMLVR